MAATKAERVILMSSTAEHTKKTFLTVLRNSYKQIPYLSFSSRIPEDKGKIL